MQPRRLRCPHCQKEFEYDLVPGMSVTALRLGTSRYMRCPLCRRWGVFPLNRPKEEGSDTASGSASAPPVHARAGGTGEGTQVRGAVPRFNDRRPMARWGALLVVPAGVLIVSGVVFGLPASTELLLAVAGTVVLCVGAALLIGFSLPDRVR